MGALALVALAALGLALAGSGGGGGGGEGDPPDGAPLPPKPAPPPIPKGDPMGSNDALVIGDKDDPEVVAAATELRDYLASQGVDFSVISMAELLTPRALKGKWAVPPRHLWPNIVPTIVEIYQPARKELGSPVAIYNGYRPPVIDDGKNHTGFYALDTYAMGGDEKRRQWALILARIYNTVGESLGMGAGFYDGTSAPSVHMDTRYHRYWGGPNGENAKYWLAKAAQS